MDKKNYGEECMCGHPQDVHGKIGDYWTCLECAGENHNHIFVKGVRL